MHIGVIGAGVGGLCAAKLAIENGFKVTVFEQTDDIGGTWIYTDRTGLDDNGLSIHTSMYHGLKTNFPKEIMGFSDFPITEPSDSYITSDDVMKYLRLYAKTFNLLDCIEFQHQVIRVLPKSDTEWEFIVNDLSADRVKVLLFDAVIVCNGHNAEPIIPTIPGSELFRGDQIHSHDYRRAEQYHGEDVLVIGGGPSGTEIAQILSKTARSVTLSTHTTSNLENSVPKSVQLRSDVKEITENFVEFDDGAQEVFTKILYCTGYEYAFHFLSMNCGIQVDDKYVYPLYKHCINIERPTMLLAGLLVRVSPSLVMEMQIRYFLKHLLGEMKLPSKEEMLNETDTRMTEKWKRGHKKEHSHIFFDDEQERYYDELAEQAKLKKLKPVVMKLYKENQKNRAANFETYRNYNFKIINDDEFITI